ncbi:MAG: hypothetical protein M1833_007210 [Piccolia ochrophora]|nr:MAG: hypothetical protein M1833_007210 [Piccolia ochrophora]
MSAAGNRQTEATGRGGTGTTSTPANAGEAGIFGGSGRRRSSGDSSGGLFSGLMSQKRGSQDASATARKASFDEQKPAQGVLGSMWTSFTKDNRKQ